MSLDTTTFPDRPACFGQSWHNSTTNTSCVVPSQSMIDFLNITDPWAYKQAYCINPPTDSCAFGYCANPDIAGPAVRIATYVSTTCLSILVLYNDEAGVESFYGQALQIYSLLVAGIISIATSQLTRLHAIFILLDVASPLSLYFLFHALRRAVFRRKPRADQIFGSENKALATFNIVSVLAVFPLWITTFLVVMLRKGWFQQTACDDVFTNGLVGKFFYGPVYLLISKSFGDILIVITPVAALAIAWIVAVSAHRKEIWTRRSKGEPLHIWRKTITQYPFLRFYTVILFPSFLRIGMLESGASFSNEYFEATYGQLLAMFVAVPPLVQCCLMYKRCWNWFINLTWVRFVTNRMDEPPSNGPKDGSSPRDRTPDVDLKEFGTYSKLYDPPLPTSSSLPSYKSPSVHKLSFDYDNSNVGQPSKDDRSFSHPSSLRPGSVIWKHPSSINNSSATLSNAPRPHTRHMSLSDDAILASPPDTSKTEQFVDPFADQDTQSNSRRNKGDRDSYGLEDDKERLLEHH